MSSSSVLFVLPLFNKKGRPKASTAISTMSIHQAGSPEIEKFSGIDRTDKTSATTAIGFATGDINPDQQQIPGC